MLKDSKSRIIILLTDGDNNQGEIEPVPSAQIAAAVGAKIYTIGIGIEEPCRLPAFDLDTGKLKRGPNGRVHPDHHAAAGQLLGARGNGAAGAWPVLPRDEPARIAEHLPGNRPAREDRSGKLRRYTTYTPLFQWPLLAAFAAAGA